MSADKSINFDLMDGIFASVGEWLETAGCPFTPEQSAAVAAMLGQRNTDPNFEAAS